MAGWMDPGMQGSVVGQPVAALGWLVIGYWLVGWLVSWLVSWLVGWLAG